VRADDARPTSMSHYYHIGTSRVVTTPHGQRTTTVIHAGEEREEIGRPVESGEEEKSSSILVTNRFDTFLPPFVSNVAYAVQRYDSRAKACVISLISISDPETRFLRLEEERERERDNVFVVLVLLHLASARREMARRRKRKRRSLPVRSSTSGEFIPFDPCWTARARARVSRFTDENRDAIPPAEWTTRES